MRLKGGPGQATTIAIVATNARLTKPEVHRLAVMAQTGLARAIYPVHTPLDGDAVFAAATGDVALADPIYGLAQLGAAAANVLARAVARGVYEAAPLPASGPVRPPIEPALRRRAAMTGGRMVPAQLKRRPASARPPADERTATNRRGPA